MEVRGGEGTPRPDNTERTRYLLNLLLRAVHTVYILFSVIKICEWKVAVDDLIDPRFPAPTVVRVGPSSSSSSSGIEMSKLTATAEFSSLRWNLQQV